MVTNQFVSVFFCFKSERERARERENSYAHVNVKMFIHNNWIFSFFKIDLISHILIRNKQRQMTIRKKEIRAKPIEERYFMDWYTHHNHTARKKNKTIYIYIYIYIAKSITHKHYKKTDKKKEEFFSCEKIYIAQHSNSRSCLVRLFVFVDMKLGR